MAEKLELSETDVGITTIELCPQCKESNIDYEPSYTDGEITGTLVNCVECDWYETFEEESTEDAERTRQQVEKKVIELEALLGWLEAYREGTVEELRETSNFDKADQRDMQSKISFIDELLEFFGEYE